MNNPFIAVVGSALRRRILINIHAIATIIPAVDDKGITRSCIVFVDGDTVYVEEAFIDLERMISDYYT